MSETPKRKRAGRPRKPGSAVSYQYVAPSKVNDIDDIKLALERFNPRPIHKKVARLLVLGVELDEAYDECEIEEDIRHAMNRDPVVKAYFAKIIEDNIENFIGFLDLKIFKKAEKGDLSSYRAFIERKGKKAPTKHMQLSVSKDMGMQSFSHLTDQQLDKLYEKERSQERIDTALEIARKKRKTAENTRREKKEGEKRAAQVLRATREADGLPRSGEDVSEETSIDGESVGEEPLGGS